MRSLRARLLVFLLAAIVLAGGVQAWFGYRTALHEADAIFDYHMQQMALSLRAGLPPSAAVSGLGSGEQSFEFVVQVWTLDGRRIFESAEDAFLPQAAVMGFVEVNSRGKQYRVFSMQSRTMVIQVAQEMTARRRMAGALALRTMVPVLLAAPLLMLVVWLVISVSLRPVDRMRRQVAARQPDDLSPLSESGVPDEVRPLVHELNLLFARVGRAFEAQQHFVADAAHELRSPLAALKLQAQSLQRAPDEAARGRALHRLAAGIDRAARLVDQLLTLARQEAHAAAGAPLERVDLLQLTQECVAEALPMADERTVDLGLAQAEAVRVMGHPDALRILLRNLIENAVKHAPEGGRVDLCVAELADGAVQLQVEDNGPGLQAAERDRVLDRFYRADGQGGLPGSGLGLAIVRSVADLHGAALTLDSSPTLGGLRVSVRFDARTGPAAPPP